MNMISFIFYIYIFNSKLIVTLAHFELKIFESLSNRLLFCVPNIFLTFYIFHISYSCIIQYFLNLNYS